MESISNRQERSQNVSYSFFLCGISSLIPQIRFQFKIVAYVNDLERLNNVTEPTSYNDSSASRFLENCYFDDLMFNILEYTRWENCHCAL